jgi:PPM family protein phosphatase
VSLQIVEHAGVTDVGRQRNTNEDSLVVAPPFFAVADGMGGARAGEVASQLATEAFGGESDPSEPAEGQLARIVRDANRRIYELASSDESRRGMGTTLTAAKIEGDEVSIGHVGDSRAYRLRDEALEQLTRDHSLVAELERTGQISPEAAEHHPQRSIITRALGPEPDVDVDTYTVTGREGDVFLLCSDGLTGMVSDDEVASILRSADGLQAAAETLVRAANQSGGKDNITVVLFRLGDRGAEPAEDQDAPGREETIAGGVTVDEVRAEEERRERERSRAAATAAPPSEAAAPPRTTAPPRPRAPAAPRRRFRLRAAAKMVAGLLVVGAVVAGLYALSRQVYFVATNEAGLVTIYRGLPYELPLGIDLYQEEYTSSVPARAIPSRRRGRVLDHEWRGRDDAVDLVRQLERGRLDAGVRR